MVYIYIHTRHLSPKHTKKHVMRGPTSMRASQLVKVCWPKNPERSALEACLNQQIQPTPTAYSFSQNPHIFHFHDYGRKSHCPKNLKDVFSFNCLVDALKDIWWWWYDDDDMMWGSVCFWERLRRSTAFASFWRCSSRDASKGSTCGAGTTVPSLQIHSKIQPRAAQFSSDICICIHTLSGEIPCSCIYMCMYIYIYMYECVYTCKIVWDVQQCLWHAFGKTYHIAISNFHKMLRSKFPRTLFATKSQGIQTNANESFVVANRALCRCEQKNQQKSNHPIVGDIGWLIWISEFTGQCWYWSDVQRHPKIYMISPQLSLIQCLHQQLIRSPHCIWMATILASLGNSLFPSFLPLLFFGPPSLGSEPWLETPIAFFCTGILSSWLWQPLRKAPTEVVLLLHPSNSCQVCKCLTGAWLFPTRRPWKGNPCHQPGKSSRRSISPFGKASNDIRIYHIDGGSAPESTLPLPRHYGWPNCYTTHKDKNTNHQYPPSKTQGMGLERWLVTTHNNSQQKLSQPCFPPRAKVGQLSISVVAERALANILK